MDWNIILILECIGFPLCLIPVIILFFTRYNSIYSNMFCLNCHYDGEKILQVWKLILYSILAIINIITGICLIFNLIINFGLGVYQWNKSTKLYKFLSKKV